MTNSLRMKWTFKNKEEVWFKKTRATELYDSYFVHVEDQIQFADIFETFVEGFNEDLDEIQNAQL